ncbi:DUF4760 domain-containing protein [candidate division GN15 bacterium]|nr:DUF4760 domain-containing protein [candidate division GN15 bacterium]
MPDIIAIVSLALNLVVVCSTLIAGRAAWVHFRGGGTLNWLAQFNSREFFEADEIVCLLVDGQDRSTLVKRINEKAEFRIAVTYVLSFSLQAATATKLGLIDKNTLMRYTVFVIPYYWDNLRPWIEARREFRNERCLYADLEWLANEIKRNKDRTFSDLRRSAISPVRPR